MKRIMKGRLGPLQNRSRVAKQSTLAKEATLSLALPSQKAQ